MARTNGAIAALFRRRMDELGLDMEEVDARAQVGTALDDLVESADDTEFHQVWGLRIIKRVTDALELKLLNVLELKCVFCAKDLERWRDLASLPRNEIIRHRREELGLSKLDLLTKLGWMQWYVETARPDRPWVEDIMRDYRAMEDSPDSIEELSVDDVMHVAQGIEVPPQLLLGVSCDRCTREEGASQPSSD